MEKALRNYKILFLIGVAGSFLLYEFKLSGKADIALLITSVVTGFSLMNWIESKQAQNDARIDKLEIQIQVDSDNLKNAAEVSKRLIRIEARIESLKEKIKGE